MFKQGSKYTRKDVGEIYFPGIGRPKGGTWDTGYVRVEQDLIVFMNIGIAGKTGHDFDNQFDPENDTITWFGKPNSHRGQPTFVKLLAGELTPHFFARWDNKPEFTYLGVGRIITMEDGHPTVDGNGNSAETIKVLLSIRDVEEILPFDEREDNRQEHSSFALEKHLEDFIVENWHRTKFGNFYEIYKQDGELVGRQFPTGAGPCDILALSKDKNEFLVIEMKKGRAGDKVIGQLTRYMGAIKIKVAQPHQGVRGCIVAYEDDQNLRYALSVVPNIDLYTYKINFDLEKIEVNR